MKSFIFGTVSFNKCISYMSKSFAVFVICEYSSSVKQNKNISGPTKWSNIRFHLHDRILIFLSIRANMWVLPAQQTSSTLNKINVVLTAFLQIFMTPKINILQNQNSNTSLVQTLFFFRLISASEIRQFQYAIPIYLDIWTSSGNSNLKRMLIKTLHDHQHYTLDYHATPFMPVVFVNSTECLEAFKLFVCLYVPLIIISYYTLIIFYLLIQMENK